MGQDLVFTKCLLKCTILVLWQVISFLQTNICCSSLTIQWMYITYLVHIGLENLNISECSLLAKIRYNNFIDQILLCVWPQVDDISIHVNTKINLSIKRHFRSLNSCRKSSSSNHNERHTHTQTWKYKNGFQDQIFILPWIFG